MKLMRSIKEANVQGHRVIVWSDLDVPVEAGRVIDNTRLKSSLGTIEFLLSKNSRIILLGHAGRPKARDEAHSLKPIAAEMGKLLGKEIELLNEIKPPSTEISMLENIRFWSGEEERNEEFAQKVSSLGDIYVNDCFSTSHHAGSTMFFLPKILPSYAGLALEKEVNELSRILTKPERPLIAILAGAKLETKLPAINNMSKIADKVLVGGKLMFEYKEDNPKVVVAFDDVDGADIGPNSIQKFEDEIKGAATIVWNGTLGKYEDKRYTVGTEGIAKAVIASGAYTIIGGGDTIAVLHELGLLGKINHVSMGGGAMLEFLAGKQLEGLVVLGYYD